jgi:hypothetical protein
VHTFSRSFFVSLLIVFWLPIVITERLGSGLGPGACRLLLHLQIISSVRILREDHQSSHWGTRLAGDVDLMAPVQWPDLLTSLASSHSFFAHLNSPASKNKAGMGDEMSDDRRDVVEKSVSSSTDAIYMTVNKCLSRLWISIAGEVYKNLPFDLVITLLSYDRWVHFFSTLLPKDYRLHFGRYRGLTAS